ncbi:MAG: hypothetical protein M1818_002741 [Claussenomyces sp. TS43310]|nr:MAG: hypothetical protein M1818_002741 [Claussenomyces sp. TS43310]
MRSFILTGSLVLAFSSCISTSVIRRASPTANECCFELLAQSPTLNGTVEEDTIGENRVRSAYPDGNYCVSEYFKGLRDVDGHTCLISPSSQRFECYGNGIATNTSFTINPSGNLMHDGSPHWLACPSGGQVSDGSYYIFSDKLSNPKGCVNVTLLTGGYSCAALGRPSSSSSVGTAPSSVTQSSTSQSAQAYTTSAASSSTSNQVRATYPLRKASNVSCPSDLSSSYLAPKFIVPVSLNHPETSYGPVNSTTITANESAFYAFDVPSSTPYTGSCALLFLFPYGNQAAHEYSFTGTEEEVGERGGLGFVRLSPSISPATTYNSAPGVELSFGTTQIIPGHNYTIASFPCPSGRQLPIAVSSVGGVGLKYFQNDNPSAIGLYVVPCA